jgi:hypothetical protein
MVNGKPQSHLGLLAFGISASPFHWLCVCLSALLGYLQTRLCLSSYPIVLVLALALPLIRFSCELFLHPFTQSLHVHVSFHNQPYGHRAVPRIALTSPGSTTT